MNPYGNKTLKVFVEIDGKKYLVDGLELCMSVNKDSLIQYTEDDKIYYDYKEI